MRRMNELKRVDCALQETKRLLREDFAKEWQEYAAPEAESAWGMLSSPAVVAALGGVLRRLAGGKQKAESKL
jgi:Delta3-Delta2-enoyl-CoA isomerase